MYFSNIGVNKDRSHEFFEYRDPLYNSGFKATETSTLIDKTQSQQLDSFSPLDPFFKAHNNIKSLFSQIQNHMHTLDKIFKENKQPNFGITLDIKEHVHKLQQIMSKEFDNIIDMIQLLNPQNIDSSLFKDRETIINNLHQYHLQNYHSLKAQFQLEIEELTTLIRADEQNNMKHDDLIDFTPLQIDSNPSENHLLHEQEIRENEEIEEICRRAQEIQSIFLQLAEMISLQGTIIDRIDMNIQNAKTNAEEAHKQVKKAESYQRKSNKMWICVIILLIMIIILIIAAIIK